MTKRVLTILIALTFVVSAAGCGMFKGTTEKYMEALNKTSKADSMQAQTKYTISMDLSKAPGDVKKDFEKFKDITVNTDEWIDNKNKKAEVRSFLNMGEVMLDSKLFVDGDKVYLKTSFTGDKYIDLASAASQNSSRIDMENYEKLYNEMLGIWKNSVETEILAREGNSIENTPDGDIKVSILSLQLDDMKTKSILKKLVETISKNDTVRRMMVENKTNFMQDELSDEEKRFLGEWIEKLPENFKNNKEKIVFENLKLTAKIDKDSYIIDETFEGTLVLKFDGEVRVNINMHTTRWNINSGKVKVNIPDINKGNTVDLSKLNESETIKKMKESFKK